MSALDSIRAALPRLVPASAYRYLRRVFALLITPWASSWRSGHLRSAATGKIVDAAGNPLPWYTLPAVDFLSSLKLEGRAVLEFGSGYSSMWWAKRVGSVVTFEANSAWLGQVQSWIPASVELHPLPTDENGKSRGLPERLARVLGSRRFDVIVIDGADRLGCAEASHRFLKDNGIIIFDNSDTFRDEHGRSPILDLLRSCGFGRVDFYGLAPGNLFPHCTSLLFRDGSFAFAGIQDTLWVKPFDRAKYEKDGYSQAAECDIRDPG